MGWEGQWYLENENDTVEPLAECTVVVGPMGYVRAAGGRTDDVLGVPARELSGRHLKDILSRPDRGRLFDLMREALMGTPPALADQVSVDAGSSALLSVVPMEADGAGKVESWVLRFARVGAPAAGAATATGEGGAGGRVASGEVRPQDLSPAAIERALRDEQFGLDLQPIVQLETGLSVENEALVRWVTPDGDRLPAGTFIEAVERAGLMGRLTEYVLERSLDQVAGWTGEQSGQGVTVNVTAADLVHPTFPELVGKLVANAGVDPDRLVLEFGSDLLDVDLDTLERSFTSLRRTAGVRLAIDELTARRSPMTAFCLPVDVVKLDPIAAQQARGSSLDATLLAMFTDLCHTSGITVIGTGIEDPLQLETFQRAGVSHGQGYLLGRPSPLLMRPRAVFRREGVLLTPAGAIIWSDLQRAIDRLRSDQPAARSASRAAHPANAVWPELKRALELWTAQPDHPEQPEHPVR